ncbi:MAG TPA: FHA domain-containing protein [Thermoleophilaceae bacterium]
MDEPLAVALKFGFLAVLYLFLIWVARSAMRDLRGYETVGPAEPAEPPSGGSRRRESAMPDLRAGVAPRLEVVAAMGFEPGTVFDIGSGATMGRADSAEILVDDPFASSAHAHIFPRGEYMYLEDMGSTNGTYLNGRQVKSAERLKVADLIRIGDSEYRYEE